MNYLLALFLFFVPGNKSRDDSRKQLTKQFLIYVESNKIDSAIMLIDQHQIRDRKKLFQQLESAHRDITSFKKRTYVSIMLIGSSGNQFYRCRYFLHTPNTAAQYRIDIYFDDTKPDKVSDVKLFDSTYMAEDHKQNLKLKDVVPPPPPVNGN